MILISDNYIHTYSIYVELVSNAISHLKLDKNYCVDGLSSNNFKNGTHLLNVYISLLFSSMLVHGTAPAGLLLSTLVPGASPGFGRGGGKKFFFQIWEFAKPCALLGGFGGMLPRENFLKRCNLVRFRVYFDQILSLFFLKNAIFYIKNKYFRYTFVMGYFS